MQGFCQELKMMVGMENVQTVQLPDLSFVHRGVFKAKGRTYQIFKKVGEADTIVTSEGHHVPREIFVGKKTPTKLFKIEAGQVLIYTKTGRRELKPRSADVKTLESIKLEREKENEKNIKLGS